MSVKEDYKDTISEICNRAIRDNMLYLNNNIYSDSYNNYYVKFKSKPWFEQLDKKIQEDTIKECKKIFKQKIYQIMINEYNKIDYTIE
jgi:hypothetical protein